MLAWSSTRRSWVQIPPRTPFDGTVRKSAKRRSSNLREAVGSTPSRATVRVVFLAAACKAVVKKTSEVVDERFDSFTTNLFLLAKLSAMKPPVHSRTAGSRWSPLPLLTQASIRSARSSIGPGRRPLKPQRRVRFPHGPLIRPSGETGKHATFRPSCPYGLGSSTLPLVTRTSQRKTDVAGGPVPKGVS